MQICPFTVPCQILRIAESCYTFNTSWKKRTNQTVRIIIYIQESVFTIIIWYWEISFYDKYLIFRNQFLQSEFDIQKSVFTIRIWYSEISFSNYNSYSGMSFWWVRHTWVCLCPVWCSLCRQGLQLHLKLALLKSTPLKKGNKHYSI